MPQPAEIDAAYREACRMEIEALKPGNVHRFADGHRMSAQQFLDSAEASAPAVCHPRWPVGRRILDAIRVTREVVDTNTNLGIVLLCAPLAKAAEAGGDDLQRDLAEVLGSMTGDDARDVFRAITLANPGGLGEAKNDVAEPPRVPLLVAMQEAADRDLIARQYVSDFADIFSDGLAAHKAAASRGEEGMWPTVFTYLHFLSTFPDSHVARKHGTATAENVRLEAISITEKTRAISDETERLELLVDFDRRLKTASINPGTSADLTVATVFTEKLNFVLHNSQVSD